ncbi:MAG: D-2-hydroxyacid dehydrogenase [Spirochaetales bacterium]|nr:D-2-hydroxyacid dehydrogenase [Spirochaetales bacterium]
MSFRLLLLEEGTGQPESLLKSWSRILKERVPGIDIVTCKTVSDALEIIPECEAAFGDIVPELFARARKLRWIMAPHAGPRAGYYHEKLVNSNVVVTNFRGIYNDHLSIHAMMFVLALAKNLHLHVKNQAAHNWEQNRAAIHLPDATALVVGLGAIGAETARLCSEFGMTVIGTDPRVSSPPPGVSEVHTPDALDEVLPGADFVIATVPETPQTQGLFTFGKFKKMKKTAFFINIGRGKTVVLDDLVRALREGEIRGAGLDVFEIEPLPADHPLWDMPNVLMTPHVGAAGPHIDERRTDLFVENCRRFNTGEELLNIVDKANWF